MISVCEVVLPHIKEFRTLRISFPSLKEPYDLGDGLWPQTLCLDVAHWYKGVAEKKTYLLLTYTGELYTMVWSSTDDKPRWVTRLVVDDCLKSLIEEKLVSKGALLNKLDMYIQSAASEAEKVTKAHSILRAILNRVNYSI